MFFLGPVIKKARKSFYLGRGNLLLNPFQKSRESVTDTPKKGSKPRLYFIDNLRIGLISLVVAHHVGQAYGPTGGWRYITDPANAPVLGVFFTVNRSFFMSLFFMISGYFLPQSFDWKGDRSFLKDRALRLGIPLLVFFFVIIPVMMYVYHVNFRPYGPISFLSYYFHYYFGHGPRPPHWIGSAWPDMNFGHLWFIEHLLLLAVCYWFWRLLPFSGSKAGQKSGRPPKSLEIIIFAIMLAAATFVVRFWYPIDRWIALLGFIQVAPADVPRDLSFFVIGVFAYRHNWPLTLPKKTGMIWLLVGLMTAAFCYGLYFTGHGFFIGGGLRIDAMLFDLWEAFLCCGICIGFLVLFREKLNHQGMLARELAASTYAVYLFHVPVLVSLQYALRYAALSPLMKFFLVTLIAIPITFAISSVLRRAPLARAIL
jgi:glucans biosynthesis protein C